MNTCQEKSVSLSYLILLLVSLFCPIYAKYNDTSYDYLYYGADNVTDKKLSKQKTIDQVIETKSIYAKTADEDDTEISLLYNNSDLSSFLDTISSNSTTNNKESFSSCYSNLKSLNHDMYMAALMKSNENDNEDEEHIYIICPNTIFKIPNTPSEDELALIPTLSNTKVQCGENGDMNNRCIINGGIHQVLFHPKIVVQNVYFIGLQFVNNIKGVSVAGWGHPLSSAFFYDCRWFVSSLLSSILPLLVLIFLLFYSISA